MFVSKILTITDDSGFLALVNADRYPSFVDEDWKYGQLEQHFVDQMNCGNLIVWATGAEGEWTVRFTDRPSDKESFRAFSKCIEVTNRQLWLTNFEDLTMAAQFEDQCLPSATNEELFLQLDNGIYTLTIRQLFDPEAETDVPDVAFEVVLDKAARAAEQHTKRIFWLELEY